MRKIKASAAVWAIWIILTILIAGGLVYYYQFTKIPAINEEISNLKDQVADLQEQIAAKEEETDETADWETYENTKYNFSVKYPPTATPRENDTQSGFTVSFSAPNEGRWMEQIGASSNNGKSLTKTVTEAENDLTGGATIKKTDNITIAGTPAIKWTLEFTGDQDYGNIIIFIVKNDYFYQISSDTSDTNFDNFLSTFQFTD